MPYIKIINIKIFKCQNPKDHSPEGEQVLLVVKLTGNQVQRHDSSTVLGSFLQCRKIYLVRHSLRFPNTTYESTLVVFPTLFKASNSGIYGHV